MHKPLRTLVSAAVLGITTTATSFAGGFALYTEGAPYLTGNYGAGAAAEANDASIGWYNPAGLVLIKNKQVVFGGVGIFPSAKINGTSTFRAPPLPNYVQTFSGLNGSENAFVPSFHYAMPLGDRVTAGLSLVSPFGLSTDWGPNSPVRYQATFTELLTTNLSPEIGGKLTDNFSVGLGLDLQYARVKFNRMLGVPNLFVALPPFNPAAVDTLTYNKGSSYGVGFHAGLMAMFNDNHTRLGLNYQSKMKHTFHGHSELSGILANSGFSLTTTSPLPLPTSRTNYDLSSNTIELPDVLTLSAYHDLNDTVALLGSVVYTGWSVFKNIQLNEIAAPAIGGLPLLNVNPALVNSTSPQYYKDAWRASIGANYKINPQWMLRVGGGYDQTPTNDLYRDVRLPDTNRWALAIGAHYQMKPTVGIEVGYTHLFAPDDIYVNRTDAQSATSSYNVTATGKAYADLVGAQVIWTMDQPAVVATK